MYKSIFIVWCFLLQFGNLKAQKLPHDQNLFKKMWISDTCGQKGYREILARYISTESWRKTNILFETKKDVLFWLGNPDKIYDGGDTDQFCYIVSAGGSSYCSLDQEDSVETSLNIGINKKTEKVTSIIQFLR